MKQTAVEWIFERLERMIPRNKLYDIDKRQYLEQAKEMDKEQQKQMLIGLLDWMNKVAQDNPMAFETDSEDIVDMYLRGYYDK